MNPESNIPAQDKAFFTVNVIGGLIIGLIIGFIIGAYYGKYTNSNNIDMKKVDETATSTISSTTKSIATYGDDLKNHLTSGKSEVTVNDTKAGNTVILKSVSLDHSYWVAIRDNAETVKDPYILGARRLQPGDYKNVLIALSRNTIVGKKYDVVLYKDTGGSFDYDQRNLIAAKNNSAALVSFIAK